MQRLVIQAAELGIIDTSFIALDSTPVSANTCQNNPKSFAKNKFSKDNQPQSDKDCRLGVHTASNQHNERKIEYYWGYKNHVLVDCITGLPISEITTTADVADSKVVEDILNQTNKFISIDECTFIADKGNDVKAVYNLVKDVYHGDCIIPLNKRNTKNPKSFLPVTLSVKLVSLCTRTAYSLIETEPVRSTAALTRGLKTASVPATTMITDFLLTVNAYHSRRYMLCVPKLNVTIPDSSQQVRSVFGYTASMLPKI